MSLQAAIDLVQRASSAARGPLGGLRAAVQGVTGQMRAFGQMVGGPVSRGLGIAQRAVTSLRNVFPSLGGSASAAAGQVQAGAQRSSSALSVLKMGMLAAAGAGVSLAAAGGRYLADTLAFRENTQFAFGVLARSTTKAQELMGFSDELARSLGKSTVEVGGGVRELLAKGFDPGMIRSIVSGMADLSVINPEANIKLLTMAIGQVKSKGVLMMEELRGQIAEQGLDLQAVYKHIAANLKIKTSEVEKAISGKKVSADVGITSILQAIQEMSGGGALGAVSAAKAVQTVGGAFANTKAQAERMLLAINTGPVGQRLIRLAHQAGTLFDPTSASGKRLLAVFDSAASSLGNMLGNISPDDLVSALDSATSAARSFLASAQSFGGGFFEGLHEASTTIRQLKEELGMASGPASASSSALRDVGVALGYIVVGVGSVAGALGWLVGLIMAIPDNFSAIRTMLRQPGADMIDGLIDGITSGLDRLRGAVRSIKDTVVGGVEGLFKINSPSRVMMQLGAYTTAGFTEGLDRGPRPDAAMRDLVTPPPIPRPSFPAPSLATSGARGASARGSVQIDVGGIIIEVHGVRNVDELLEQAEPTLRRKLTAIFEELALEAGAAA